MSRCASWCANLVPETPLCMRSLGLPGTHNVTLETQDRTTERPLSGWKRAKSHGLSPDLTQQEPSHLVFGEGEYRQGFDQQPSFLPCLVTNESESRTDPRLREEIALSRRKSQRERPSALHAPPLRPNGREGRLG
jgi:hypothetical protein